MPAPTILVTILHVPDDPDRNRRALRSVIDPLDKAGRPRVEVCEADSQAEALELFRVAAVNDYLVQLDGRDLLYPSWLASVDEHLRRCHAPDAVAYLPRDYLQAGWPADGDLVWELDQSGTDGGVWLSAAVDGVVPCSFAGHGLGTEGGPWDPNAMAWARVSLLSRRGASRLTVRDLGVPPAWPEARELWNCCELLAAYQAGDLNVRLSMASDLYLEDRVGRPAIDWPAVAEALQREAATILEPMRSGLGELPVVYPRTGCGAITPPQKLQAAAAAWLQLLEPSPD